MTVIKYLQQVQRLEEQRQALEIGVAMMTESTRDTAPRKLKNIQEHKKRVEQEIIETKQRLLRQIDSLDDYEASDVLYLRYIRCHSFKDTAEIMSRKLNWVYWKHERALKQLDHKFKEYQRSQNKKFSLIKNGKTIKTGTLAEIANHLNITIVEAHNQIDQQNSKYQIIKQKR